MNLRREGGVQEHRRKFKNVYSKNRSIILTSTQACRASVTFGYFSGAVEL